MTWTRESEGGSIADPNSHTHSNKSTLDLLGTSGSQLTFNGSAVGGGSGGSDKLSGLRWGVIGDSITRWEFSMNYTGGQPLYWGLIENRTGIDARVYALENQQMATQTGMIVQEGQMLAANPTLDVITVFGGTNDVRLQSWTSNYIGQPTDTAYGTLCGGTYKLLEKLWADYPGVPIGIILPYWYAKDGSNANINGEWNDAMKATCNRYGVPVLDLLREGGFSHRIPSHVTYYVPDDLHPNERGHLMMSYRVEDFLRKLIAT